MCRVVARDSAWAQAEGGIVNIIAMTDVSACHWGSAGNAVPGGKARAPRRERRVSEEPCTAAGKRVQENLYPNSGKRTKR